MKKKLVVVLLTGVMTCSLALTGCSKETPTSADNTVQTEEESTENAEPAGENNDQDQADGSGDATVSDQAAADEVAALIDAIYVQQRTEDTDAQCA